MLLTSTTLVAERKVVLSIKSEFQTSDHGFSIVKDFTKFIYPLIVDGKIKLWTDANKSKRIDGKSLQALEVQSQAPFQQLNQLLIYEMWENQSKKTYRKIHGISFVLDSRKDEIINFGFIDFSDLTSILKTNEVKVNATGYSPLTWWQVFQLKIYDYEMVTLDGSLVTPRQERKVTEEYFSKGQYNPDVNSLSTKKRLLLEISKNTDSINNQLLHIALISFIKDNQSEFIAQVNETNRSLYLKKNLSLSSVKLVEEWSNSSNGLTRTLLMIGITPEGSTEIDYISAPIVNSWNILINDDNFTRVCQANNTYIRANRINSQEIPMQQSQNYLNALYYRWDSINEYLQQK